MHYSQVLLSLLAGTALALPAAQESPALEARGGSTYSIEFFTDSSGKNKTGEVDPGNMTDQCQQVPDGTGYAVGNVQNVCVDVFTDANCQTKYASLSSGGGWCSSHGKGWIDISGGSSGPDGAGMLQPIGGNEFSDGAAPFGSYSTGDKMKRDITLGWSSFRGSVPS